MNTSKTTITFNSLLYPNSEQYVERISFFLENLIFLKIDFNQGFHLGEVVPRNVLSDVTMQSYDIVMSDFSCIKEVVARVNEIAYGPELTNIPDPVIVYEINLLFDNDLA